MPYPSYTQFQRFLATLLLFSFLLESCHNPNIGMGRRAISPPQETSGGNTSPEEELYDNAREQRTTTAAENRPIESRQTAPDSEQAQEQPGQRQEREALIEEVSEEPAQPSTAVIPPLPRGGNSAGKPLGRDQHQGEPATGSASGSKLIHDPPRALELTKSKGPTNLERAQQEAAGLKEKIAALYSTLPQATEQADAKVVRKLITHLEALLKLEGFWAPAQGSDGAKEYITKLREAHRTSWGQTEYGASISKQLTALLVQAWGQELKRVVSERLVDKQGKTIKSKTPDGAGRLAKVLGELAALHQEQGEATGDLAYYTDAATLYQNILRICGEKKDKQEQIEAAYRGLVKIRRAILASGKPGQAGFVAQGDLSIAKLQEEITGDKKVLQDLRADAEKRVAQLEALLNKQGSQEEQIAREREYIAGSKKLFSDIAKQVKEFLARLYQESEEALIPLLGPPPCKYTVIGLGSMALEQMTPYSDLEFAILMEEDNDEARAYLRQLTHLVHCRVINLGETVIPQDKYGINLDHLGKKGINFDLGGKTPLVRKDKPYDLIQPVSGMLHYLSNEEEKIEHIDKNLPHILESTCSVYGDGELHRVYTAEKSVLLKQGQSHKPRALKRLEKDVVAFKPQFNIEDEGRLYNVKQAIYRLPDRLLYGLAMYYMCYGLLPKGGWDTVEKLAEQNIIGAGEGAQDAVHHLQYAVSFAMMLRLKTYLHHEQQGEDVTMLSGVSAEQAQQAVHKAFLLPEEALQEDGSLFRYYYTALALYSKLEAFYEEGKVPPREERGFFREEPFYDDSDATRGAICQRLLQYEKAIEYYKQALSIAEQLYGPEHPHVALLLHKLGSAWYQLGDPKEATECFEQALSITEQVYGEEHPDVALSLNNLGLACNQLGNPKQAIECFKRAKAINEQVYGKEDKEVALSLNNLGRAWKKLGDPKQAIACFKRALEINEQAYNQKHLSVATSLNNLGTAWNESGDPKQAIACFKRALEINEKAYGPEHPAVATSLNNLGFAWNQLEDPKTAIECFKRALEINKQAYGEEHPAVAASLSNLGSTREKSGYFKEAIKFYGQALGIYEKVYGSEHPEVATNLNHLGFALNQLGDSKQAISCFERAFHIIKKVYGEDHPSPQALKCNKEAVEPPNSEQAVEQGDASGSDQQQALESPQGRGAYLVTLQEHIAQGSPAAATIRAFNDGQEEEMPVETRSPAATQEARQALREHYQQPEFAQVKSLFQGEPPKHVDSLECQLMLTEPLQKQADPQGPKDDTSTHHERPGWVKNPIALEDMFKRRSTKPGEKEREIQKVLLVGDPGTGKTTLSRKLAYLWAKGRWGKELKAVYVLPVRALQESKYDDKGSFRNEATLATAIANNCFSPCEEEEYKRLRQQINEELKQTTTLVVLDGLDEGGAGTGEAVLKQAEAGRHKLLMLSRPYGIEQERTMADIEIEHAGLNDEQMEAYVRGDLSSELGEELLAFIKEYPAIGSIAHVPVNLQILCTLWKDNRASVRKAARNGSLPGLYRRLSEYTWERYVKERKVQDADYEEVFDTLGEIALDALQQGQQLISRELVQEHVAVSRVRELLPDMQAAGFLLLQSVGSQYQFPHLTFQEYFAGRTLARQLFSREAKVRAKAKEFFTHHKYAPQYGRMLSFLSGEVSNSEKLEGTCQLLKLANTSPQEVVGVQHLLLQLRLLNEWLCLAGEDQEDELAYLERKFRVMDSLKDWFVEGLDRVRGDRTRYASDLLDLLTTPLQRSRALAAHAPALLELLLAACKDSEYYVRSAASEALGEVKASPKKVIPLLQEAMGDESEVVREVAIKALGAVCQADPEQVIPLIQVAMEDESEVVREAAIGAFKKVGKADPEQVIPLIQVAMRDVEQYVRSAAIEALGKVGQAVPEQVILLLQEAMGDENEVVRYATIKALGEVGKAKPEQVISLLQKAMGHESQYVRYAAIEALEEVGKADPEKVIPLIREAMEDESEVVREAAIGAFKKVGKADPEKVIPLLQVGIRDKSQYVRKAAIEALGELEKTEPEKVILLLQKAMRDEDWRVRCVAIGALGEVGTAEPEKIIPLLQAAIGDESQYVRSAAIKALGAVCQADPEEVIPLIQKAIGDKDFHVRSAAIKALGAVCQADPEEVIPLLQKAMGDKDFHVRSAAIKALGAVCQASPEQVIPLLQKAMGDESQYVREAAIEALGAVGEASPEQVIPLLQVAMRDEYYFGRFTASNALRRFSLKQIMDVYWATQHQGLIPLIATQLYRTPLLVRASLKPHHQKLVLYLTVGKPVEWEKPHEEVQHFVQLIKSAAKQKPPQRKLRLYFKQTSESISDHFRRLFG